MSDSDADYQALKGFLGHFFDRYMSVGAGIAPEHHPIAVLNRMEAAAPKQARQGLTMAINDCLEMSAHFTSAEVKAADTDLSRTRLPTLSALRLRFWKRIRAVLKRGRIRTEVEYYAIKNAVEVPQAEADRARLWALLEDFEARAPSRKAAKAAPPLT
jgi:hypothetical protein